MFAQKVLQLLPYMGLHLVFSLALCFLAYWVLVKRLRVLNLHWTVALVTAIFLPVYYWGGILINSIEFHPTNAAAKPAGAPATPAGKSAVEMKSDFLKAIDDLTVHPDMLKPEVINQLFSQYAAVVKSPEDKKLYYTNILRVYECQKYFLMDALASLEKKVEMKSPERGACEVSEGSFYGREHLLPPEVVANNDKVVATVAKKDMTKEERAQFSADIIKKTLDQQTARIEATKKIFE